jgi:hypothetical protein
MYRFAVIFELGIARTWPIPRPRHAGPAMDRSNLDDLVMLLSTDWFAPYWLKIGLGADQSAKVCLQKELREIVRQIIAGANEYWLVNFSNERLNETRRLLTAALRKCDVSLATFRRISELADGQQSATVDEKTKWLVTSISEQILQGCPGLDFQPSRAADQALQKVRHIVGPDKRLDISFEELCLKSQSQWDIFIRGLTPDLPTKLSDFLASIATVSYFDQLWAAINSELLASEKHELLECYGAIALSLTGEPLQFPQEE